MQETKFIVLRGPSGSGKSSIAKAVRDAQDEPMALIEQDYLRRIILKVHDSQNEGQVDLIKEVVLFALNHSFSVILEGILNRGLYSPMLEEIIKVHPENNYFFYFDIPFEETLRRHDTKSVKNEFGEEKMRKWYKEKDYLKFTKEEIISETNTFKQTVEQIMATCGLSSKI